MLMITNTNAGTKLANGAGSVVVNADGSETLAPVGLLTLGRTLFAVQNGLAAALTAAGSNGHVIVADAQTVAANTTVPAGVTLEVKRGGLLTFAGLAAPTLAPTTAPSATGGYLPAGTWLYATANLDSNGNHSTAGPASVVTTTTGTGTASVALANIPLGPAGTTTRWVLRANLAAYDPRFAVVGTLADNTTTTWTDGAYAIRDTFFPPAANTPAGTPSTTGGAIPNGSWKYKYSFIDPSGYLSSLASQDAGGTSATVTTTGTGASSVALTGIPTTNGNGAIGVAILRAVSGTSAYGVVGTVTLGTSTFTDTAAAPTFGPSQLGPIVNNTVTLTVNGTFEAGDYQTFAGDGHPFFGVGSLKVANARWWGALSGTVADDVALNRMIEDTAGSTAQPGAATRTPVAQWYCPKGDYLLSAPVVAESFQGATFRGAGEQSTRFFTTNPNAVLPCFDFNGLATSRFEGFTYLGLSGAGAMPQDAIQIRWGIDAAGQIPLRSTTNNEWDGVGVVGLCSVGFAVGTDNGSRQTDSQNFRKCSAVGTQPAPQAKAYYAGWKLGSGVSGNNYSHTFSGCQGVRYMWMVLCHASGYTWEGGQSQAVGQMSLPGGTFTVTNSASGGSLATSTYSLWADFTTPSPDGDQTTCYLPLTAQSVTGPSGSITVTWSGGAFPVACNSVVNIYMRSAASSTAYGFLQGQLTATSGGGATLTITAASVATPYAWPQGGDFGIGAFSASPITVRGFNSQNDARLLARALQQGGNVPFAVTLDDITFAASGNAGAGTPGTAPDGVIVDLGNFTGHVAIRDNYWGGNVSGVTPSIRLNGAGSGTSHLTVAGLMSQSPLSGLLNLGSGGYADVQSYSQVNAGTSAPTLAWQRGGKPLSVSGATTLDFVHEVVYVTATCTLTLPQIATLPGGVLGIYYRYVVYNLAAAVVTVTPNATDRINGGATGTAITINAGGTVAGVTEIWGLQNGSANPTWFTK